MIAVQLILPAVVQIMPGFGTVGHFRTPRLAAAAGCTGFGLCRHFSHMAVQLPTVLFLALLDSLPLHVAGLIGPSTGKRPDVIDDIAGAAALGPASGRARMAVLELGFCTRAAFGFGDCSRDQKREQQCTKKRGGMYRIH